jgi:hypothetical protein
MNGDRAFSKKHGAALALFRINGFDPARLSKC